MNELTPSHPAQPQPQSRGLAASYSLAANAMTNAVHLERKSFQAPRNATNKYQTHPQQLVNEYHAGPYASYSHLKAPDRPVTANADKFDYAPQQYSPHAPQQQSYAAYGYPSYTQNYGGADYQQSAQQQYHSYAGGDNALGMLVSSATNPQGTPDAMPHEPVNIGLKDVENRKFRQPFGVVPNDSFMSSGGYGATVHGVERPGNVVHIKATPNSTQQPMYQRQSMYGGGAYYSQQTQQRTQQPSQQHNPLDLVPPSGTLGPSFEATANSRGMNNGAMYAAGPRMAQFSQNAPGSSLTTRLKDGSVDISTGASSNGHFVQQQPQQQPATKPLEAPHPSSLYADVASSTSSMSMVSIASDGSTSGVSANALYPPSLAPPPAPQMNANSEETCGLCSGIQCDRIANHCGHRFHGPCLQSWGALTTCPLCVPAANSITTLPTTASVSYGLGSDTVTMTGVSQSSTGQGELHLSGVGGSSNNTNTGNVVSISQNQVGSVQVAAMNNMQVNNTVSGARPPPIDTRLVDARVGATALSGGKRSVTSTRSGSSSGSGRTRKNKKLKDCSVPGCDRTVRSRGLCKGHGGGRRCGHPGCGLSDQGGGFCISHGGGKRCQHEGCDNSAQSRGLCKLHGGGSRCTVPNCTKSSQGRGLCRAHGGGRRCMVEGCNKTDRRAGYCVTHGADKKCIIPECSKTGRIDNMCTKHYFERHPQPPGVVSTTPPPVITVNAHTVAAKARAEKKKAAERSTANYANISSVMPSAPVPTANAPFTGDGRVDGVMAKRENPSF